MDFPETSLSFLRTGLIFLTTLIGTGIVRLYAKNLGLLMDIPEGRSSHHRPTPRGGGVALVFALYVAYFLLEWLVNLPQGLLMSLIFCGGGAAFVGWADDHQSLNLKLRLFFYISMSIGAVYALGPIDNIDFGIGVLGLNIFAIPITALGLLWMLNLYNFMDGIDAQATLTGLFVCAALLVMASAGLIPRGPETSVCLVLFAALLGFLPWNMPTARIFLGDVGSCFLGTTFGLLIVSSVTQGRIGLWTWLILFTHFIVDASLTLFLRMLRGEKWTQPHRKHLFQYILRLYEKRYKDEGLTEKKGRAKAHWHVNLWIQSGNLMIIFPAAWVAQQTPLYAPYICGSIMLLYGGILLRMDRYFQISQ